MLKHAPYFICLAFFIASCAQDPKLPISAETINEIHQKLDSLSADSTYQYLISAQSILKNHPSINDSLRAENDYRLGMFYKESGQADSATYHFHRATDLVKNRPIRPRDINYFDAAWKQYLNQNRFGDCQTISKKLESLIDKETDLRWLAWVYYFEENTYMAIPDYEQAVAYNEKRFEIQKKINDPEMFVPTLITQARLKFYYLKDRKGGFEVLDRLIALEDSLKADFNRGINSSYGVFQFREGNFKKAKEYYEKGIGFTKQNEDIERRKLLLGYAYANLAEVCIELKEYEKAQAYLDSVSAIGFEHIDAKIQKSTLKYQMRLALLTSDNSAKVEAHLDSIYNYQVHQYVKKYNGELVALTKANETEKELLAENQTKEIENIKLETRFLILVFAAIILGLIGLLFFRQRKLNFEKLALQMQQRLLRSQMNPHFTFNTLSSIQNLVETGDKAASKYLIKFSRQLRLTLENSMKNYVLLEKEVSALREYLDLQLLRFPTKFDYDITLINMEEDDPILVPPMLLQPFIENSIEHGFAKIDYLGKISISLNLGQQFIAVTIEDNGAGLSDSYQSNKESASIKLISDFLKKSTQQDVVITNKDDQKTSEKGVLVKFQIPFK